jgi:uncharacterized damage-inducible protein DinB
MSELTHLIKTTLASDYRERAANLHKWVDSLSDEQFWRNPYSYGNSIGHLVLHLTGNLNYYIGARVANSGYVRNRDLEFTATQRLPKVEVLRKFDETIDMVVATIQKQAENDWILPYSAEREPEASHRFTIFMRCTVHLYHHIGQINFLAREVTKS